MRDINFIDIFIIMIHSNFLIQILFIFCFSTKKLYLIPHSHDDLGWLRTIKEYYDIKVSSIYSSVLEVLKKDSEKKKRFVFAEIGFMKMFLEENEDSMEQRISDMRRLIQEGIIEKF